MTGSYLPQDIWPIFAPRSAPCTPSLSLPLRLIQLDQDDTDNWLKLRTVHRPNDPYPTPFVAMVSLFPRRASIWNGLPWLRHKRFSSIPRWSQQPADIMRATERLHFSQMAGKLSTGFFFFFGGCSSRPLCSASPKETHTKKAKEVFRLNIFYMNIF